MIHTDTFKEEGQKKTAILTLELLGNSTFLLSFFTLKEYV